MKRVQFSLVAVIPSLVRVLPGVVVGAFVVLLPDTTAVAGIPPGGYNIVDLGTLGGSQSRAYDINDTGQVVGSSLTDADEWHACRWDNGVATDLGLGQASAINELAQTVGYAEDPNAAWRPIVFGEGEIPTLDALPGDARGINDAGQVVGIVGEWYAPPHEVADWRAFLYSDGVMTFLPTLGGDDSAAVGINESGQIVGWARTTGDPYHATLWSGDGVTDLGTLGEGDFSIAMAINESGQIAGGSYIVPGGLLNRLHAFLYYEELLRDLGTIGDWWSWGNDINDEGLVVGNLSNDDGNPVGAFVWDDQDGDWEGEGDPCEMVDLDTLIRYEPNKPKWSLRSAEGINNLGQIVGYGVSPSSGDLHAYLLDPVPEPTGLALVALGGGPTARAAALRSAHSWDLTRPAARLLVRCAAVCHPLAQAA